MRLIWSETAEQDLYAIAGNYSTIEPGLEDLILERIEEGPLILLDRPYLGAPVGSSDRRKWRVRRTPFLIIYRVVPGAIEVARVVHGMSDWQEP